MKNFEMVQILNSMNENRGLLKKRLPVSLVYPMYKNFCALEREGDVYSISLNQLRDAFSGNELDEEIQNLLNRDVCTEFEVIPDRIIQDLDEEKYDPLTLEDLKILGFMLDNSIDNETENSHE